MSARDKLSILDFSLSASPNAGSLMGALKAYADESGKANDPNCPAISMAAVIGEVGQWQDFNARWQVMCNKHQIPYLHMKEIIGARHNSQSVFAKFNELPYLRALLWDAVACIIDSGLHCRAMSTFTVDLKAVLKRHSLKSDPYFFTLYHLVVTLGTWALTNYPRDPSFQLVLDRVEEGTKKIAQAERLYETDSFMSWRGWPAITALRPKDRQGSRDLLELQAADLVAWTIRNELRNIQVWMREVKPTLGPSNQVAWDISLDEWMVEKAKRVEKTFPAAFTFYQVMGTLQEAGRLVHYHNDEERLENHVFAHRNGEYPHAARVDAIRQAGCDFPLAP